MMRFDLRVPIVTKAQPKSILIVRSTLHHVQRLNSQQLFYYLFFFKQKITNNEILAMDYVLNVFFYMMTN